MTNIKQKLNRFLEFLITNRRTGHTYLLNDIAKKNDVYIIVHSMEMLNEFDPEIHHMLVPIDKISILQGAPNKPVLLDNKVLMNLLDDTTKKISDVERISLYRKKALQRIDEIISDNNLGVE